MIRPLTSSIQSKYRSWVVRGSLILSISLMFVQIQASPNVLYPGKEEKSDASVVGPVQENQQSRQLEPGKPIERELVGGQAHSYQMTLAAGQYVKLVVEQRGIDVVVKMLGLEGKQISQFDAENQDAGARDRVLGGGSCRQLPA
jgi:hypothetical protein